MTVEHNSTDHEEALERAQQYAAEISKRVQNGSKPPIADVSTSDYRRDNQENK